ncbi:MAG: hypothetical protein NW226_21935 [Microscillaceae bacterium]|nr:hypothetical protein [Microscillaceae bacterium]
MEISNKITNLLEENHELIICPQTLYEFYVVITRPFGQNGFGLTVAQAFPEIDNLIHIFKMLPDNQNIYPIWRALIDKYEIKGKRSHSVRLTAFMQSHQINKIYTLNHADFKAFEDIIELILKVNLYYW